MSCARRWTGKVESMKEKTDGTVIRAERPEERFSTELLTRRAFWNLNMPGCDEHCLVHRLRSDPSYLPQLSRVAELDGRLVGAIFYEKAAVLGEDGTKTEVLTFGPLCVDPDCQRAGVGGMLLLETMDLARRQGYPGIIICGVPAYYPKFGFVPCDRFGITMSDGTNFDAFMGIELYPDAFKNVHGKFVEPDVFYAITPDEVEQYDKLFPPLEKKVLPGQWRSK